MTKTVDKICQRVVGVGGCVVGDLLGGLFDMKLTFSV